MSATEDAEPLPAIVDSHGHLYWSSFDADRGEVLERARQAGVRQMLVVGTTLETSRACFALAEKEPDLFPTAGIHPHDASCHGEDETNTGDALLSIEEVRAGIEELCRRPECVAVGETGLDFFRNMASKTEQFDNFQWQLDLARRLDKPVIVHSRNAHEDTIRILAEFKGVRGVLHCFDYGPEEVGAYVDLDFYVSFSGIATYANKKGNRAAAQLVPEDRILIETDCPFLCPKDRRRGRNEPANVRIVLEVLAEARGESLVELARATTANAGRLFGLPKI
ncbi:MAG: TatD DNase family protein [Planctomycetota bacterium]|jgi:TatD DNase family protein